MAIFDAMSATGFVIHTSITEIEAAAWDALNRASGDCPFLSWGFLALLEDSGALDESGWRPLYAALYDEAGPLAAAPFYLCAGQAGQFTWDGGMEELARAYGLAWFPKLVGMVPFTPSPVWRVLTRGEGDGGTEARGTEAADGARAAALIEALEAFARKAGLSGLHLQWLDQGWAAKAAAYGGAWLAWRRQAYLWENRGYRDFAAYLSSLTKNMRRNVRRERGGLDAMGVKTELVRAGEAPSFWPLMGEYYARTNDKFGPWAARFLPARFFELAPRYLADRALFSAAFAPGADRPIALALLFEGGSRLWGRYWGSAADIPGLHFEVCYYAPIEYAIGAGLAAFDPGMGGDHKARRGFRALMASSLHRVFDRRLSAAFARAVAEASAAEEAYAEELNRELPGAPSAD